MNIKQILIGKQNADQSRFLKIIKREWPSIVGDSIATKSLPSKLIDNCLTITTDSSSIHNELTLFNTVVTNRIKEKYNIKIADVKIIYHSPKI
jgi:hypothetical protein